MALYIILLIAFIIIISMMLSQKGKGKGKGKEIKKTSAKDIIANNNNSYERKAFLTPNERNFFNNLSSEISTNFHVLAQVRVADIIRPGRQFAENSRQYIALFRQISQWHVDYAIMNRKNFNIEAIIELDDSSHQKSTRQKRDQILNKALRQANIVIIRTTNFNDAKKQIMNIKKLSQILKTPEEPTPGRLKKNTI